MKSCALAALLVSVLSFDVADAKQLRFAGYDFNIKQGKRMGPGPNDWATSQAFVDTKGRLHLRFSERKGKWLAGEVQSVSRLGFGTYEIEFEGDIHGQDRNVVFGFFNYPTADVGPDATHEIDIEFARWGRRNYKPLNYTVWPVKPGLKNAHTTFSVRRGHGRSIHRFTWAAGSVLYTSQQLDDKGDVEREVSWDYTPADPADRISSSPMPIYFNLWGFQGREPSDGKPVEVIINRFTFTPAE
ncbi:MAG: glycoside hydrolase family 16 protein [Rhizobium sp.]|nr:glycoside hydrolase family 16 protein [Rhizobium sp.]